MRERLKADGNVSLLDPQGDVAFADQLVLRNEMRDGVIDTLRVLLSDNSRMAGSSVVRSGGNMTTLHRGVYSACDICEEKGQTKPLWQIKAFRVIWKDSVARGRIAALPSDRAVRNKECRRQGRRRIR